MILPRTFFVFGTVIVLVAGCIGPTGGNGTPSPVGAELPLHRQLIWSHPYPTVVVEVDYVEDLALRGREPTQMTLDHLQRTLENVTAKERVRVEPPEPFSVDDGSHLKRWTWEEIGDVWTRVVDHAQVSGSPSEGSIRIHILYLNGEIEGEDDNLLGLSLGSRILNLPDRYTNGARVGDTAAPPIPPGIAERSVVTHELGHSLGLVANPIPMQTDRLAKDDSCRCHSQYEGSVMYHTASTSDALLEAYEDNRHVPYKFDAYDHADLRAVREAEPPRHES